MSDDDRSIGIGTFSVVTRLTKRALRLYDEKGLLHPIKREITGYRLYSFSQMAKGIRIKRLANLGFGIPEMKEIMDILEECPEERREERLNELLLERIEAIDGDIARLEKIRGSLLRRSFLEVLNMEKNEPCIKEVPSQRVVSIREIGTYEETIPRLMKQSFGMLFSPENQRAQVRVTGPPMFICHDDEEKAEDADIEIAIPIAGNVTVGEGYEVKTLDGGRMVSYLYKGPYEEVGPAFAAVMEYISREGLKMNGPSRELFLNDPKEVPESELLSEIQIPVE